LEVEWATLKLLITGASGLFGSKLAQIAISKDIFVYSCYSKDVPSFGSPLQFDVVDSKVVQEAVAKVNPDVVVHAATLTDVDKCELNQSLAWQVNVEGTKNIAQAAQSTGAFLVYISTDYVFSGEKGSYKETDITEPVNYYGLTKLKAEEQVKTILSSYCIARPSVIYGSTPAAGKVNFDLWLIEKLQKGEHVKIVTDQFNSPTLNTSLVDMTLEIIERKLTGVFHTSGATRISRYNFAVCLAEVFGFDKKLIDPATSAIFKWPAKRPADSSLDTSKAMQILLNKPLEVTVALQKLKKEIKL
jgi:dTDP-4-dehydrorhamnose reductase